MQKKFLIAIPVLLVAAVLLAGCTAFEATQKNLTVKVVDASTDQAIQGANVNVYTNYNFSLSNLNKWWNISGQIQGSKNTNENGKATFLLPTLSSGTTYAVSVYKEGYWANGQEVELMGDKAITVKMYPVKTETLTENNGDGNYEVTQALTESREKIEWNFSPEIKFAAGRTDYNKERDGGNQYFKRNEWVIEIVSITNNSITAKMYMPRFDNPATVKAETYTDGGLFYKLRVTIKTNQNGLYLFKVEPPQ